jgi:hypothetical protein
MQMRMVVIGKCAAICGAFMLSTGLGAVVQAQGDRAALDRAVDEQVSAQRESAQGQTQIDALDEETRQAMASYRALLQEEAAVSRYNEQMARQVEAQRDALTSLDTQLNQIDGTAREVMPLMQRMVETLPQIVDADMPFLEIERAQRVADLQSMLDRADVTVAEKYRRILEAYQVEAEYGRTLEAYQGALPGDDARQVEFLRIGRVALMYMSLDGSEAGYWSPAEQAFVIDADYRNAVRQGLRIARRQVAPDWVQIPVSVSAGAAP